MILLFLSLASGAVSTVATTNVSLRDFDNQNTLHSDIKFCVAVEATAGLWTSRGKTIDDRSLTYALIARFQKLAKSDHIAAYTKGHQQVIVSYSDNEVCRLRSLPVVHLEFKELKSADVYQTAYSIRDGKKLIRKSYSVDLSKNPYGYLGSISQKHLANELNTRSKEIYPYIRHLLLGDKS